MQKKLQTNTAEEILSTVYKPIEYFIDGLLAQGLYILAGSQKVGKSWLALDICHSIATGSDVLKRKTVQGRIIQLDYYSERDGSDGKNDDKVTVTQRYLETSQTSIQR